MASRRTSAGRHDLLTGERTWHSGRRSAAVDANHDQRRADRAAVLCSAGSTRATTKWQEAIQLEKDLIKAVRSPLLYALRGRGAMAFGHFSPGDRS
jgi:hypothetical protein